MATDEDINQTDNTVILEEQQVEQVEPLPTQSPDELIAKKMDEFMGNINGKIDELTKSYEDKVRKLEDELKAQKDENAKLTNVNKQILLSTGVGNKVNEITDFSQVSFEDVDWDKQASKYMSALDSKIFN